MLKSLRINNIALIKSQSLEFEKGLNVLTGETGAGKSLVVDALSLLLGEKAEKSLISRGEKSALVEAVFSNVSKNVQEILEDNGLEREDTLVITRKISSDGKNECRVNGNVWTLSMLKRLSAPLMDLHGQFEHQNLLKVQNHLKILDLFAGKKVLDKKREYEKVLGEYEKIIGELSSYSIDDSERERMIDLYKYQIDEIEEASFYEGEEEELKNYRSQVLNQEKINEALDGSIKLIGGDGYEFNGSLEEIKKALNLLSGAEKYYAPLQNFSERLDAVKIELDDIVSCLEETQDGLYIDEEKAKQNEERLDLLSSFKKKYGQSIEEINGYYQKIKAEYDRLSSAGDRIEELKRLKKTTEENLLKSAKELSDCRKESSKEFEKQIKTELVELGMKSASFVVCFESLPLEKRTPNGLDKVEFMFSANLGEQVKPLKDVASGGEMSRFMLAVKNITASLEGVSTLIFDEIDTGVSGHIALTLAQKLKKVSKQAQVICVSHLPQIASYGDNHLLIEKFEEEGKTITKVKKIEKEEREKEIARLISGNLTEHSLMHAKELLKEGKNFK